MQHKDSSRRIARFAVVILGLNMWTSVVHGERLVQLQVDEPLGISRQGAPVTGGVPLAQGLVAAREELELRQATGERVPAQFRVLSRWPDKSLKWVLVDFQSDLKAEGSAPLELHRTEPIESEQAEANTQPLRVTESSDRIEVDTGSLRFAVRRHGFNFLDGAWIVTNQDGQVETQVVQGNDLGGCRIIGLSKNIYWSSNDKNAHVVVEEQGPLRVVIHAQGQHVDNQGNAFCEWQVRIHAFAGKSYLRVFHTLTFTGDPESQLIRDVSLHLPLVFKPQPDGEKPKRTWSAMLDDDLYWREIQRDRYIALVQDQYDHVKLYDETFERLPIERIDFARISPQGERLAHARDYSYYAMQVGRSAPGIMDYTGPNYGISLCMRHFRELYPNEIQIDASQDALIAHLWPVHHDMLSLSRGKQVSSRSGQEGMGNAVGTARTQEMFFDFHAGSMVNLPRLRGFAKPLRLRVDPSYIAYTRVFGNIHPYDPERFPELEELLAGLFDWQMRHVEHNQWYGKWDFGATQIMWNPRAEDWTEGGRQGWTVNEVNNTYAPWIMYARTGDPKYLDWAEANTRYLIDVGTVHGSGLNAGAQRRHAEKHWSSGTSATHTFLHAPLAYYYFTGDMRAYDAIQESARLMVWEHQHAVELKQQDKLLRPQWRGFLNPLNAFAQMLELTGDQQYQRAAHVRIYDWMAGGGEESSYGNFAIEEWMMRHGVDDATENFYLQQSRKKMLPKPTEIHPLISISGPVLLQPAAIWLHEPCPAHFERFFHGQIFRTMGQAYWMSKDESFLRVGLEDLYDFLGKVDRSDDWRYRGNLRGWNTSLNLNMCYTVPYFMAALADLPEQSRAQLVDEVRNQAP